MESDLQHHHHFLHDHQQHHQKQMNSGLMRYQSAPGSYFSSILDRDFCEEFPNRPPSPETERFFARLLGNSSGTTENISNQNLCEIKQDSPVRETEPMTQVNQQGQQIRPPMNNNNHNDTRLHQQQQQQQSNYSVSQNFYQNQSKPPLPDQKSGTGMNYSGLTSMGMERLQQMRNNCGNNSNLVRHSSSPAGLFSNVNIEFENVYMALNNGRKMTGYAVLRGMGDFRAGNRETSYTAASRPPSSGRMSPIAENSTDNTGFGDASGNNYVSGFSMGSWDDSAMMTAGAKGLTDEDRTLSGTSASENQSGEAGNPPPALAHHLSLPKTSAGISAIEKFLQVQDSVPCKIRAKRGCATHPRSIAERVRRSRISERMRKLQDLVPNMDKQTNTADMLDLAVDYIKDLQRQVNVLSENRAKCTCTNKKQG